jgi:hypothetical protein
MSDQQKSSSSKGKELQAPPSPSPPPDPELSNEHADAKDFGDFLRDCKKAARETNTQNPPYIHLTVLSFIDGKEKANWLQQFEDAGERDVFADFWKHRKADDTPDNEVPAVWLALCSTKVDNWVGKEGKYDFSKECWHAWAVAVIRRKEGNGKHILIFDPDRPETVDNVRYRAALWGSQRGFVHAGMRAISPKTGMPTGGLNGPALRVWLGGGVLDGEETRGKDKCVEYSTRWLKKMALLPSEGLEGDKVTEDARFKGCNFIPLKL